MTAARKNLLILSGLLMILALSACTREITYTEQVVPDAMMCFNCHNDQDTELVAMETAWQNSLHASGLNTNRSSRSSCSGCHSGDGLIARANGEEPGNYDNPTVIHCFACHAPHTNGDFRLRITEPQTLVSGTGGDLGPGNLCVACHQARRSEATETAPDEGETTVTITSSHFGPHHGNQADMLFGLNGYDFGGSLDSSVAHRDPGNERGCVGCHYDFTRNFVVGGHSFNMVAQFPIEEGNPLAGVANTAACTQCHESIDDPDDSEEFYFNHEGIQVEVTDKMHYLEGLLEAAGWLDHGHVNASRDNPLVLTPDEAGAIWNWLMVYEDRSWGVHNPAFTNDLLDSAIDFMEGRMANIELAKE